MSQVIRPSTKTPQMVKSDEGFSPGLYIDTLGFQTIGIGFCLDKIHMPEEVADFWCGAILDHLDQNMANTPEDISRTYLELSPERKAAILNMAYQMGISGVCKFQKMWAALAAGDYEEAAKEALDSVWAKQTKKRAKRVSEVIRSDSLECYRL